MIGGALDPGNTPIFRAVLERRLDARPLCVVPLASEEPHRSMRSYVDDFEGQAGPGSAVGIDLFSFAPGSADDPVISAALRRCGGVFFTGGDQSRIVDVLRPAGPGSTAADRAIASLANSGAVIAGTSAGAAVMSDPMIGGGASAEALAHGVVAEDGAGVWLRPGMGFFGAGLTDQHFLARGRFARLAVALATDGGHQRGIGIDEDTALVVEGEFALVVGSSSVVVLENHRKGRGEPVYPAGFDMWVLGDGDRYDLRNSRALAAPGRVPVERGPEPGPMELDWQDAEAFATWLGALLRSAEPEGQLKGEGWSMRIAAAEGFTALELPGGQFRPLPFAGPLSIELRSREAVASGEPR
jgi:cyanophycinase